MASLSVVGTEALADEVGKEAIQRRIGLVEGGPFHSVLLQNAVDGLAALYDERGFEGTEINSRVTWPEERRAAVDILAREGTPIVLDRVSVRGRARTAPGVIERLIGLKPGDRVTTLKLLAAQRRLYGLGIFSRADLELLKTGELSDQQDLIVSVTEAPARRLSYALGYDSDEGPRGLLGWYHCNLFGRALSWQNDIRLSRDEEQLRTFFSQPFPGRFPIIVSYAGFRLEQQRPSYFSKQLGSQVQADYYAATRRWSLLYGYRNVDLELDEGRPTGVGADPIPREDQQVQISSVTPSLFVDRRDDPIDARRGWSSLLALESAFPSGLRGGGVPQAVRPVHLGARAQGIDRLRRQPAPRRHRALHRRGAARLLAATVARSPRDTDLGAFFRWRPNHPPGVRPRLSRHPRSDPVWRRRRGALRFRPLRVRPGER